jgi:zinc and cadmium transporter
MMPLIYSILSAAIISLISISGIIILALKDKIVNKILLLFISFSAGALLGGAFFHLLPEAIEEFGEVDKIFPYALIGICLFFILERVLRWHHCHQVGCDTHIHLGYLNLIGDGVHNMIDGLIIISAFSVSPSLGIPVVLSVALHEIPQEIGDFGVLLYSGFKKKKALLYNFLSALTVIIGVVIGYFLLERVENMNMFLLPFAAGGFIYIAASDLIPELHREKNIKKSLISFLVFALALVFMYVIKE